jgi:hypothetical protein
LKNSSKADINLVIQQKTRFATDNGIAFSNVDDVRSNQGLLNGNGRKPVCPFSPDDPI